MWMSLCKLDKYAYCFSHLEALPKALSPFGFPQVGRNEGKMKDKCIVGHKNIDFAKFR